MGFFITKLKETELGEYIGSQTIYSCADHGAFDSKVDQDLEEYVNKTERVIALVDASGISHFLDILKNKPVSGRDVQKLIQEVENNYMDGFMIVS